MQEIQHSRTSAAKVSSDNNKTQPRRFYDSDGDPVEPCEVHEVREAAKRCVAILKDTNDWIAGAELRRRAELNEYCTRNWTAILALISDDVEINDYSPLPRYRYVERERLRVLNQHERSDATWEAKKRGDNWRNENFLGAK